MSAKKLLERVISPGNWSDEKYIETANLIRSDPLTLFAILFSALIHDIDHAGVPNSQLINEEAPVSLQHNVGSCAEQNSIVLAWELLMDSQFVNLRKSLFANDAEMKRFRQIIINAVMATDLFDKDLKSKRERRWSEEFESGTQNADRRATIVIEHIIQAADVSHTMQHVRTRFFMNIINLVRRRSNIFCSVVTSFSV